MQWDIEYTDEFGDWWGTLTGAEHESIAATVGLLEALGPNLRFPHTSGVYGARRRHMRELRIQHHGRPCRILFAFDPRRSAILLIGGDKTGNDRWYEQYVPIADGLYDIHLKTLRDEGLSNG